MLAERMDVANAAFLVGYESPSQFNREYSRMFGAPPLRDNALYTHHTAIMAPSLLHQTTAAIRLSSVGGVT
jgi:AraC-like DNA-binding protein